MALLTEPVFPSANCGVLTLYMREPPTIQLRQHHISGQNFNRRQLRVIISDRSQFFSRVHTGR